MGVYIEQSGTTVRYKEDGTTRLVVVSSDYTVLASDGEAPIEVDDTSSARIVTLPARKDVPMGRRITVKDGSGGAGANAITVAAAGSDAIDGASAVVLRAPYASVSLYASDDGWSLQGREGGPIQTVGPLTGAQQVMNFTGLAGNSQIGGYRADFRLRNGAAADRDITLFINGASTNVKRVATRNVEGAVNGDAGANGYITTIRPSGTAIIEISFPFPQTGERRLIHVKSTTYKVATNTVEFQFTSSFVFDDTTTEITQIGVQASVNDAPTAGSVAYLYLR